jgi:hypothetical protein
MVPGTTEQDYYAGKVSGSVPEQEPAGDERIWAETQVPEARKDGA